MALAEVELLAAEIALAYAEVNLEECQNGHGTPDAPQDLVLEPIAAE